MSSTRIGLKRIYDAPEEGDGMRVLVDRVWPRGVSKAEAGLGRWLRNVAPSTELRKWFRHDPERWEEFKRRYRRELADSPTGFYELLSLCREGTVTLLFAARDREHNQAVVLRELLDEALASGRNPGEAASPVCFADRHD